jgi:hypothetical protein
MRRSLVAVADITLGSGFGLVAAVARKRTVVLRRMWCDGTAFRWGRKAAMARTPASPLSPLVGLACSACLAAACGGTEPITNSS